MSLSAVIIRFTRRQPRASTVVASSQSVSYLSVSWFKGVTPVSSSSHREESLISLSKAQKTDVRSAQLNTQVIVKPATDCDCPALAYIYTRAVETTWNHWLLASVCFLHCIKSPELRISTNQLSEQQSRLEVTSLPLMGRGRELWRVRHRGTARETYVRHIHKEIFHDSQ